MDKSDGGICSDCRESLKNIPDTFMVDDSGLIYDYNGVREPTYNDLKKLKKSYGCCSSEDKPLALKDIRAVSLRLRRGCSYG